jgi:cobalt-zinc-cadmium efflux system outer membrane protein
MTRHVLLCVLLPTLLAALAGGAEQPAITLEKAVSEALANNLALLAERANISIAEARLVTAGLRPNPVVSAGGDHLDFLGTGFNDLNGGGPTETSLRTDFTIERGGKRQARVEVARAARSVAELQFHNAARLLALEVENAVVESLAAHAQLALARETLAFLKEIADLNAVRVKAGDLAEVELVRSELAAVQFENTVRQAELREQNAATRLATLVGRRDAAAGLRAEGELRRDAVMPPLAEAEQEALASRPDLAALRRDTERAAAEVRSQIAQRQMDWTVGSEYRRQSVSAQANTLGLFFSMPLPVFNRNQGEIARAQQEQRQAQLRVGALETAIRGEVAAAHHQCAAARGMLDNIEANMLGRARDVRQITEFRYRRGEASFLEFLDALRAFNETMQGHAEARAEYARALFLLDSVAGRSPLK